MTQYHCTMKRHEKHIKTLQNGYLLHVTTAWNTMNNIANCHHEEYLVELETLVLHCRFICSSVKMFLNSIFQAVDNYIHLLPTWYHTGAFCTS
jgi:hypothetical protein